MASAGRSVRDFYHHEAELLDGGDLRGWLSLLDEQIAYRVPVRLSRERDAGHEFSTTAFYMEENFATLRTRVHRLANEYAWAENPPTRTRRFVGNIRVGESDSATAVHSNIAVFCYRGDEPTPVILTAERRDRLSESAGHWRLRERVVLLDATVLGLASLSIFL